MAHLGSRLIRAGLCSRDQLAAALIAGPASGGEIARRLVARGLDEDALVGFLLAEGFGPLCEGSDLSSVAYDALDPDIAHALVALPLRTEGGAMLVAMADPSDEHAVRELRFALQLPVEPRLAPVGELSEALERSYPETGDATPIVLTRKRASPAGTLPVNPSGPLSPSPQEAAPRHEMLAEEGAVPLVRTKVYRASPSEVPGRPARRSSVPAAGVSGTLPAFPTRKPDPAIVRLGPAFPSSGEPPLGLGSPRVSSATASAGREATQPFPLPPRTPPGATKPAPPASEPKVEPASEAPRQPQGELASTPAFPPKRTRPAGGAPTGAPGAAPFASLRTAAAPVTAEAQPLELTRPRTDGSALNSRAAQSAAPSPKGERQASVRRARESHEQGGSSAEALVGFPDASDPSARRTTLSPPAPKADDASSDSWAAAPADATSPGHLRAARMPTTRPRGPSTVGRRPSERQPRPTPAPRQSAPADIGPVLASIRASTDRDEIVDLACEAALTVARAVVLLALRKGTLRGWSGKGPDVSRDAVRNLWIPGTTPSMFKRVLESRDPHNGPYGQSAADSLFRAAIGGRGSRVMIHPILVGGRAVALLCADDPRYAEQGEERLEVIAHAVGQAFRRILVSAKK